MRRAWHTFHSPLSVITEILTCDICVIREKGVRIIGDLTVNHTDKIYVLLRVNIIDGDEDWSSHTKYNVIVVDPDVEYWMCVRLDTSSGTDYYGYIHPDFYLAISDQIKIKEKVTEKLKEVFGNV